MTPLHFAAQQNAMAAATVLLEAGATVDITDKHGNTPLWTATLNSRGQGDMIQLLRDAGANALHQNNYGRSPLTLARAIANYDVEMRSIRITMAVRRSPWRARSQTTTWNGTSPIYMR